MLGRSQECLQGRLHNRTSVDGLVAVDRADQRAAAEVGDGPGVDQRLVVDDLAPIIDGAIRQVGRRTGNDNDAAGAVVQLSGQGLVGAKVEHIEGSRVINGPAVGEKVFKHIDPAGVGDG